ncbi:MAG: hypothetical protein WCP06_01700 [Verrucomicrobiota bacterium]
MKHTNPARGIYQREGGIYWLTYQVKGIRTRCSLETTDFAEAVQRAEKLRIAPALQPSEGLAGEVHRFIAYKIARKEYTRDSAESKGYVLAKFAMAVLHLRFPRLAALVGPAAGAPRRVLNRNVEPADPDVPHLVVPGLFLRLRRLGKFVDRAGCRVVRGIVHRTFLHALIRCPVFFG